MILYVYLWIGLASSSTMYLAASNFCPNNIIVLIFYIGVKVLSTSLDFLMLFTFLRLGNHVEEQMVTEISHSLSKNFKMTN